MENTYKITNDVRNTLEALDIALAIYEATNNHVKTLLLSNKFIEIFGLDNMSEAIHLMDNDMYRDTHPEDIQRIKEQAINFTTKNEPYDVIYRTKNPKTNEWILITATGIHIEIENHRIALIIYEDLTHNPSSQKRLQEVLHEQYLQLKNNYDTLTGLPNMSKFTQNLNFARKNTPDLAVIYINVIGMSMYNTTYGFSQGDEIIKKIAKLLAEIFTDENCAHLTSDRFAAFCSAEDAKKLVTQLNTRLKYLENNWQISTHTGIYFYSLEDISGVIALDRAKYAADTKQGKQISTITTFDKEMMNTVTKSHYILTNLDYAIKNNKIQVWYQPIINPNGGIPCDQEALARWTTEAGETLSPAEFIPLLENTKLLYKLDLYVIEQVLRDMQARKEAGLNIIPTSVNISRTDFESINIVDEICERTKYFGIENKYLHIEITESVAITNYTYICEQIKRFRELGFSVWIDDFGSGFSSFEALQHMEFDLIKFDMGLTKELETSYKNKTMVEGIAWIAKQLGLKILAEGVETQKQSEILISIGCDKLQGYLYGKPQPHTLTYPD